jgi:hypothetical protein
MGTNARKRLKTRKWLQNASLAWHAHAASIHPSATVNRAMHWRNSCSGRPISFYRSMHSPSIIAPKAISKHELQLLCEYFGFPLSVLHPAPLPRPSLLPSFTSSHFTCRRLPQLKPIPPAPFKPIPPRPFQTYSPPPLSNPSTRFLSNVLSCQRLRFVHVP